MGKVVGPGSLIVDIAGYAPHVPVDGETVLGTTVRFGPGGKGNNQLTAARRAGAESLIISAIGDDFLSSIMTDHYDNENMRKDYIKVVKGGETGSALIEIDDEGRNRIIVVKGANEEVGRADVLAAEKEFEDADVVLTQLETSIESVFACKELAHKYNKPFILNPAPFQEIPEELLDGVDYLTPNETEAEFFTGVKVATVEDASKAADVFLAKGVKNVVITLGKAGAYYKNAEEECHIQGITVKAVDTTGAGDAFNGGFAAAKALGMATDKALCYANCVGALSVTKKGTAPAMPHIQEIKEFMKKYYNQEVTEV